MTEIARKKIQTSIFGCGGFAMNILSKFEKTAQEDNLTHLNIQYLDTSASNIEAGVNPERVYLFRDTDGFGKDRKAAYEKILPMIPNALQSLDLGDFNIIVHSSSGGSGSAIGPALVNHLLKAGKRVIVVQVGSVGSRKEVENTMGVIRTYANFAKTMNRPVLSYYRENNSKTTRTKVDAEVHSALLLLSMLFSSENKGLDTADLSNLIDYNKVTSFEPELSTIDFHCKEICLPESLVIQAAAVLFSAEEGSADEHEATLSMLEYRAEGFLNAQRSAQVGDKAPIYSVVYTGDFVARLKDLEDHKQRFEAAVSARSAMTASVGVTETPNQDGFVF